jgi:hypothetical protein
MVLLPYYRTILPGILLSFWKGMGVSNMRRLPCLAGILSVSLILLSVPAGSDAIAPVPAAPALAPKIDCIFTTDKNTYAVGEIPLLTVRFINNTGEEVTLLRPLDGSQYGRHPVYRVKMRDAAGKAVDGPVGLCGTLNRLKATDFIRIPAGQSFAPFGDEPYAAPELYRPPVQKPGVYTVRFYYSSTPRDIKWYMGSAYGMSDTEKRPSAEIARLFERVPKFEVLREIKLTFTARTAVESNHSNWDSPAGTSDRK